MNGLNDLPLVLLANLMVLMSIWLAIVWLADRPQTAIGSRSAAELLSAFHPLQTLARQP